MKDIRKYQYKRIDVLEMQKYLQIDDYVKFASIVQSLLEESIISPVKSSKTNGKIPALNNKYNILKEKVDYSESIDELNHRLNPQLYIDYYLKHLEQYQEDRPFILKFNSFLNDKSVLLKIPISENERSFQIWNREKYLKAEGGKRLLNNLGFSVEKLNIYPTTEPLSYFSIHRNTPQKILILENKDTFYTMRHYLLMGYSTIFGENIATVIYGRGKDIWKTFNDFTVCIEPYLLDARNEILYLGDLDFEGIFIYEQLYENFKQRFTIRPFTRAYCYMIDKYHDTAAELPLSKEKQNKNLKNVFYESFSTEFQKKIKVILESRKYIPQEIINLSDLLQEVRDET